MDTQYRQLAAAAQAIRSSVAQLVKHVDDLAVAVQELGVFYQPAEARQPPRPSTTLRVDTRDFSVHWSGKSCHLGHTLSFRLMCEFAFRPNQYLQVQDLLDDVWNGHRSATAVRSAISHLRAQLIAQGMANLAACIDGRNPGHYGLMVPTQ